MKASHTFRVVHVLFIQLLLVLGISGQNLGLQYSDTTLSFDGYTLFAPQSYTSTYLIDNCGRQVHSWSGGSRPGLAVYLDENGQLIRAESTGSSVFTAGGAGGRVRISDWNNNAVWSHDFNGNTEFQHHDVEPMPNGNLLVILWDLRTVAEATAAGMDPAQIPAAGIWSEKIIEVEPIGADSAHIVWEWSAWDHMIQDFDNSKSNYGIVGDHPELINTNYSIPGNGSDWFHFNAVDYNDSLDQIVVSTRSWNEIWIIDHSTTTAEAAGHTGGNSGAGGDLLYRWGNPEAYDQGGPNDQMLFGQHNPQWIPSGYIDAGGISIYNNGGTTARNYSTVDIIAPPLNQNWNYDRNPNQAFGPATPYWSYGDNGANYFLGDRTSGVQQQPNGNMLVCIGPDGHFFEIDQNGNLAWEYQNPVSNTGPATQGTTTGNFGCFRAERYAPDFAGFSGRTLTPGDPIELNFNNYSCHTIGEDEWTLLSSDVYPNPFNSHIYINLPEDHKAPVEIYDSAGRLRLKVEGLSGPASYVNTEKLERGFYILKTADSASTLIK